MVQMMITLMPCVIALLSFFLVLVIAFSYHPERAVYKTYIRINHTLKEKKSGLFDYEATQVFLKENGASWHYGSWINPIRYETMKKSL